MTADSKRQQAKLKHTYQLLRDTLSDHPSKGWIETFDHVWEVEHLRIQQRPKHIRLLLIAESHVRVRDLQVKGACFIYEPRYYTPWWGDLFLPAFGAPYHKGTTPTIRRDCLDAMREEGFW